MTRRLALWCGAALWLSAQDAYGPQRAAMVRLFEERGVRDPRVLRAMRAIPREQFMPPGVRDQAYADRPAPIGYGQTISQPYIVAFMTEALEVRRQHRVLEIGTGSGYQAAVLAALAGEISTIEIVPQLAETASATLQRLGYENVTVRSGDGYAGWPEKAPFDRILLTAAPAEIPQTLVEQLKPGGRLIAPVGPVGRVQQLTLLEKSASGKVTRRTLLPVMFVPMVKGRR